ncbi:Mobile element protein [Methanosarcina siciliae C2J]|uniref:Mobile element protein n=1 Tax=Methanosarcina siciliae C2J TaxID=1434118 RepID=A0A0E3PR68_9EURY|nr:Mobile element protein [Methanosarcina siciliae C2J]
MNITKQRAFPTIPNKNICLPIETTLAVQYFFEKLNSSAIFGKYKNQIADGHPTLKGRGMLRAVRRFLGKLEIG